MGNDTPNILFRGIVFVKSIWKQSEAEALWNVVVTHRSFISFQSSLIFFKTNSNILPIRLEQIESYCMPKKK